MACCCCQGTVACRKAGQCEEISACECEAQGGVACGPNTGCGSCGCCCIAGVPSNAATTEQSCNAAGGLWVPGVPCESSPCAPTTCEQYTAGCDPFPGEVTASLDLTFPKFYKAGCNTLIQSRQLSLEVVLAAVAPNAADCFGFAFDGCTGEEDIPFVSVAVKARQVGGQVVAMAYVEAYTNGPPCGFGYGAGMFCDNSETFFPYVGFFTGQSVIGAGGGCLSGMDSISGSVPINWAGALTITGDATGTVSVSA